MLPSREQCWSSGRGEIPKPEAFGAGLPRHRFGFKCTQPYRLTARTPLARHGFEHSVAARTAPAQRPSEDSCHAVMSYQSHGVWTGGFAAPVSGRHFPISVPVYPRPVGYVTETEKDRQALRFVPHGDLKILDPIWTTAYITRNQDGCCVLIIATKAPEGPPRS